jgi:hypothetical protein
MMMVVLVQCTAGSKYLEYNPASELTLFSLNNETMNKMESKRTNENKSQTKDERKVKQQTKIIEQH